MATEALLGSTVLVTGARGFIGSHLVKRLVDFGVEVHAASRRPLAGSEVGATGWQVDLTDAACYG